MRRHVVRALGVLANIDRHPDQAGAKRLEIRVHVRSAFSWMSRLAEVCWMKSVRSPRWRRRSAAVHVGDRPGDLEQAAAAGVDGERRWRAGAASRKHAPPSRPRLRPRRDDRHAARHRPAVRRRRDRAARRRDRPRQPLPRRPLEEARRARPARHDGEGGVRRQRPRLPRPHRRAWRRSRARRRRSASRTARTRTSPSTSCTATATRSRRRSTCRSWSPASMSARWR